MKKAHLFSLAILLLSATLFTACKKSSSGSSSTTYFVKFKLDGVQKEYKGIPNFTTVTLPSSPVIYSLAVQASLATSVALKDHIAINANDIATIATGKTYKNQDAGGTIQAVLMYYDNAGNAYSSVMVNPESINDAVITFSEVTSTYVSGTFTGKVAAVSGGTTTYTITEGSFKVPKL